MQQQPPRYTDRGPFDLEETPLFQLSVTKHVLARYLGELCSVAGSTPCAALAFSLGGNN
jgi:hypothetical protein